MSNAVSNIIGSLAMFLSSVFVWKTLYQASIDWKDRKIYIITLFMILFGLINYFYNLVFFRILFVSVFLFISNRLFFKRSYKETSLSTVFSLIILAVSDMTYGFIVVYFLKVDINEINNFSGTFFANIYVFVLSFILVKFSICRKGYQFLNNFLNNIHRFKVILFSLLMVISLNLLLALIFFRINIYYVFVINIVLILVYSYILVKNLETSSKNAIIANENIFLLESLHQYEDMVDRQRVDNHENKNQLLIIKNMIKKKDKDLNKYIDSIIKDKKEDDEILYTRVKTIPSGGLQGIIYQKMLVMKDERIQFSLDVSRDIRKINLDNLSMDDNYRLCKIVGVLLDNAIEASRDIEDKCIMISLYIDEDELIIDISNRFSNSIDIDKIDEQGYTTKGNGHGYGLSLVKKILSETDTFENEKSIKKDVFKQVIKVKIKNT